MQRSDPAFRQANWVLHRFRQLFAGDSRLSRFSLAIVLYFVSAGTAWPLAAIAAELPTADEILQIHRANKERLSHLHLQLVHVEQRTDAWARNNVKAADRSEAIVDVYQKNPAAFQVFDAAGTPIAGKERANVGD